MYPPSPNIAFKIIKARLITPQPLGTLTMPPHVAKEPHAAKEPRTVSHVSGQGKNPPPSSGF